jgi:hypothetical protein
MCLCVPATAPRRRASFSPPNTPVFADGVASSVNLAWVGHGGHARHSFAPVGVRGVRAFHRARRSPKVPKRDFYMRDYAPLAQLVTNFTSRSSFLNPARHFVIRPDCVGVGLSSPDIYPEVAVNLGASIRQPRRIWSSFLAFSALTTWMPEHGIEMVDFSIRRSLGVPPANAMRLQPSGLILQCLKPGPEYATSR